MEGFKKKLLRQQVVLVAGLFIACVAVTFGWFAGELQAPDNLREFILGFQTSLFALLACTMVFFAIRNSASLAKPEDLKKLYISETDERTLFIRQKAGSTGMNIITYGLIVATVVAGSVNYTVFLSLLGACFFVAIIRGSLKLYYRNKF